MDKTKLNLERLRAYDAEWDENKHPLKKIPSIVLTLFL